MEIREKLLGHFREGRFSYSSNKNGKNRCSSYSLKSNKGGSKRISHKL